MSAYDISPFKFTPSHQQRSSHSYTAGGGFNGSFTASSPAPILTDNARDNYSPAPVPQAISQKSSGNTGNYKLQTNDNGGFASLRVRKAGK